MPTRSATAADVAEIKRRRASFNGKAPSGFAAALALELGLTNSQVKTALYDK